MEIKEMENKEKEIKEMEIKEMENKEMMREENVTEETAVAADSYDEEKDDNDKNRTYIIWIRGEGGDEIEWYEMDEGLIEECEKDAEKPDYLPAVIYDFVWDWIYDNGLDVENIKPTYFRVEDMDTGEEITRGCVTYEIDYRVEVMAGGKSVYWRSFDEEPEDYEIEEQIKNEIDTIAELLNIDCSDLRRIGYCVYEVCESVQGDGITGFVEGWYNEDGWHDWYDKDDEDGWYGENDEDDEEGWDIDEDD